MPLIKSIIKEPLSKGFSSYILKWCRCAMLMPAKRDKKELDFLMSNSTR